MIYGVGTDVIELSRIKKAAEKEFFLKRCFTEKERREAACESKRLAGDFAVKEAVAKAFGTGFRSFWLRDIEVLRDGLGAPYVKLHGAAAKLAEEKAISRIHVSISDTAEFALSMVILEC